MTVRELLTVTTCGLLITSREDPNNSFADIEIPANCIDEPWWLSDSVLDHEIHLMTVKQGSIFISLFVDNDRSEARNDKL